MEERWGAGQGAQPGAHRDPGGGLHHQAGDIGVSVKYSSRVRVSGLSPREKERAADAAGPEKERSP